MIELHESNVWNRLSSPFGNSGELPSLILKLSKTFDKSIADEILWEYMYHQETRYETTLATVPHLMELMDRSGNSDFKLGLILSLGVVLVGFDRSSNLEEEIFYDSILDKNVQSRIKTAFFNSLDEFNKKVTGTFTDAKFLDEQSKRYFLIAHLVTRKKHREAETFIRFSENDEYVFVCPNCEEETYLWNEENTLNAYRKDPVFTKNQEKLEMDLNGGTTDLEWLEKPIDELEIHSLKSLVTYFKAKINCHRCGESSTIFDGILNSF